jgi:hypothetical protein
VSDPPHVAFNRSSPIVDMAWAMDEEHAGDRLVHDYFGLHRLDTPEGMAEFNLPYGEWIRLFTENGLLVESLIEPRPDPGATSTYRDDVDRAWSRRWPAESLRRCRKR